MKAMQYAFMLAVVHILFAMLIQRGDYFPEVKLEAMKNARKAMKLFLETAKE